MELNQSANEIIKNAKEDAKKIMQQAKEEAEKRISESALLESIKIEAEKIKKQALECIDTKKIQTITDLETKEVDLYEELKNKSYLEDDEFKNYIGVLQKLANPHDSDNRNRMYEPFIKVGYYYKKPVGKMVCLTRCANLEGEMWLPKIDDEKSFQVSNYGRVRKVSKDKNGTFSGEILLQYENSSKDKNSISNVEGVYMTDYYDGYLCVDLPNEKSKSVHQLVAEYWLDKIEFDKNCTYDVHHINNNGYQNTPDNLIWLKRCQHKQIHPSMKFPDTCKDCPICENMRRANNDKT